LCVVTKGAALPAEHTRVTPLVAAVVDEAPLLAGVKGLATTRTGVVANADLRIATKRGRIWKDKIGQNLVLMRRSNSTRTDPQ